jgi:putative ABC transport system permease protein
MQHLRNESRRMVELFGTDAWVVADGASGPFTTAQLIPADSASAVRGAAGVTAASPLLVARATVKSLDVNVVGYEPGGLTEPPKLRAGRAAGPGEAIVDTALGLKVGDEVTVGGKAFPIVGSTSGTTFYFGQSTIFLPIDDVQETLLAGQPLASAIVTKGRPTALPPGLVAMSNSEVRSDLSRTLKQSTQTLGLINGLLWLTAAGIIGSIIYLTALERVRDTAVLKATGASGRSLMGGLALEALILAVFSAVVAGLLAKLIAPTFPFQVEIPPKSYVTLLVVALVVGMLASLAGLRRVAKIDPAAAFGAA